MRTMHWPSPMVTGVIVLRNVSMWYQVRNTDGVEYMVQEFERECASNPGYSLSYWKLMLSHRYLGNRWRAFRSYWIILVRFRSGSRSTCVWSPLVAASDKHIPESHSMLLYGNAQTHAWYIDSLHLAPLDYPLCIASSYHKSSACNFLHKHPSFYAHAHMFANDDAQLSRISNYSTIRPLALASRRTWFSLKNLGHHNTKTSPGSPISEQSTSLWIPLIFAVALVPTHRDAVMDIHIALFSQDPHQTWPFTSSITRDPCVSL